MALLASRSPKGVYFCSDDVLRVGMIVASELPRDRSTLLVRLMVAGPMLPQAVEDLAALSEDAHERVVAEQILLNLRHVELRRAAQQGWPRLGALWTVRWILEPLGQYTRPAAMLPHRPVAPKVSALPYRKLQEGRDYWILDDAIKNPHAIRERLLQRKDWTFGAPYRDEGWPGMRALPALLPDELESIESWVRKQTGAKRLTQRASPEGTTLNNNCVQLVGAHESGIRPHTDSRLLCNYAAVLYLSPSAPPQCGTSFYRVRQPNGQPGGNYVSPPHATLVDALGMRVVPPNTFVEDMRVDHRFNRLLVYRSALIHSASAYCGVALAERRMTVVFFWMG